MQDRQPGAPGQYKATLSAAEFQKMQAGEQFTITMVRDDQPIVEGTPYSKAAVLPDELAAIICPDVLNPSPADALRALLPKNGKVPMTANLPMGGHRVTGLGEPVEDGDAVPLGYARKVGNPHNLLDNSDFRNPVNQRGFAGGELARNQYCVDRWLNYNETDSSMPTSLSNKGVTISNAGSCSLAHFIPQIANLYGKTMTVAVGLADGTVICGSNVVASSAWSLAIDIQTEKLKVQLHTFDGTKGVFFIHPHQEITVAWAALYEGEYTAETLPEYQPKGYGAELAECLRYFERIGGAMSEILGDAVYVAGGFSSFMASVNFYPKRIPHPTISLYNTGGYRLIFRDPVTTQVVSAGSVASFGDITVQSPCASIVVNLVDKWNSNAWVLLQRADNADSPYIDISADL